MNNAIRKIIDENEYVVELVKAKTITGEPFFSFVLLQKSNLQLFRDALAAGVADFSKYGVILASGSGHEPSPEIFEQVKKQLSY